MAKQIHEVFSISSIMMYRHEQVLFLWSWTSSMVHVIVLRGGGLSTIVFCFVFVFVVFCFVDKIHKSYWYLSINFYQFSLPQIVCSLGGSSKIGSHVYFLLIVAMVLLLWHQIVLLWHQITLVASEQHVYQTIVLPRKLANKTQSNLKEYRPWWGFYSRYCELPTTMLLAFCPWLCQSTTATHINPMAMFHHWK